MKLYNNLTKELESFKPLNPAQVTVYSCGPTVYDESHIGHARSCIAWDLLYRYLKFKNYSVTWIRNITNIDDKIVNRASEFGVSPDKLSRYYTFEFWQDMRDLNISLPDFEPRATDYLAEMISFIESLINKGFAYEVNGDVYFRVRKHKNYGQLKGQNITELAEGETRVATNDLKEFHLDFALWKAFPEQPETSFQSPWSIGRPGWHLECSTMIQSILQAKRLGFTLDIHCGGDDLIFPHHENECAQSECLTGFHLAKFWLHNGMVMINGKKMSKSENNFFTIKDLLKKYKSNTIRYFCLSTHYKKQINFSDEALNAAQTGFDKLFTSISKYSEQFCVNSLRTSSIDRKLLDQDLIQAFTEAMDQDLNSPQALALLFDNKDKAFTVAYLLDVLGFSFAKQTQSAREDNVLKSSVGLLLDLRDQARINKDFATSDRIRESLNAMGLQINDIRGQKSEWHLD